MISIIQKTLNRHHLTCRSWFDQWIPIFRLEDEIRKKREEEDEKLMEKYAQLPKKAASSDTEDGLTFCRPEKSRQGSAWRRNS